MSHVFIVCIQSRHSMFHASGKGAEDDEEGDEEEDEEEEKPEISEEEQERVARQKKLGREAKQVNQPIHPSSMLPIC